ncbi:MAG: hypothetical protein FWC41_12145 [Firmicutes bacterium]|nr:hypothetical protein [Bacillota bacterium]
MKQFENLNSVMETKNHSKNGKNPKNLMCKGSLIKTLIVVTLLFMVFGCKKDYVNHLNSDNYEFFTNPNDPCFFKAVNKDGSEIIFSGDKDKDGNLLSITNIKVIKGNTEYNVDYSNGKAIKFYDSDNNTISIEYENTNTAIASFIGQNSDTIYHFQITCENNKAAKSFANKNDEYYLRYKIKLEYVDIAPHSKFFTSYYNHKIIIYDDYVRYEKKAELIEWGNDYAIYQTRLNPNYENEPLQNYISEGLWKLSEFFDATTGIDWADLAYQLSYATPTTARFSNGIYFVVRCFETFIVPTLEGAAKATHTNRKVGDSYKITVQVKGTGANRQTKEETIKYTDLKQQQHKDFHLEIILENIFPFEEVFMYSTDPLIFEIVPNELRFDYYGDTKEFEIETNFPIESIKSLNESICTIQGPISTQNSGETTIYTYNAIVSENSTQNERKTQIVASVKINNKLEEKKLEVIQEGKPEGNITGYWTFSTNDGHWNFSHVSIINDNWVEMPTFGSGTWTINGNNVTLTFPSPYLSHVVGHTVTLSGTVNNTYNKIEGICTLDNSPQWIDEIPFIMNKLAK